LGDLGDQGGLLFLAFSLPRQAARFLFFLVAAALGVAAFQAGDAFHAGAQAHAGVLAGQEQGAAFAADLVAFLGPQAGLVAHGEPAGQGDRAAGVALFAFAEATAGGLQQVPDAAPGDGSFRLLVPAARHGGVPPGPL
jgi:hypothetical protein